MILLKKKIILLGGPMGPESSCGAPWGAPWGPHGHEGGKIFSRQSREMFFREKGPMGGAHGPLLGKVGGPMGPESPYGAPGVLRFSKK